MLEAAYLHAGSSSGSTSTTALPVAELKTHQKVAALYILSVQTSSGRMAVYEIGNAAASLILQGGAVGIGGGGGEGGLSVGTCSKGVQVVITAEL